MKNNINFVIKWIQQTANQPITNGFKIKLPTNSKNTREFRINLPFNNNNNV